MEQTPTKRLKRSDAARRLGCGITTIRDMEKRGEVHPTVVDGMYFYDVDEIEKLRQKRDEEIPPKRRPLGELAALMFARFDNGDDLSTIVRALRVPPWVVRDFYAEWKTDLELGYIATTDKHGAVPRKPRLVGGNNKDG